MKTINALKKLVALVLIINFYTANAWTYTIKNETDRPISVKLDVGCLFFDENKRYLFNILPHTEDHYDTGGCCASAIHVTYVTGMNNNLTQKQMDINFGLACYDRVVHIKYKPGTTELDYSIDDRH
jgi:hypothetical protein